MKYSYIMYNINSKTSRRRTATTALHIMNAEHFISSVKQSENFPAVFAYHVYCAQVAVQKPIFTWKLTNFHLILRY